MFMTIKCSHECDRANPHRSSVVVPLHVAACAYSPQPQPPFDESEGKNNIMIDAPRNPEDGKEVCQATPLHK